MIKISEIMALGFRSGPRDSWSDNAVSSFE